MAGFNKYRVFLVMLLVLSLSYYVLYPRISSNIIQDRELLDLDDTDDPPNNTLIENASFEKQKMLGAANLIYTVSGWVIGGFVVGFMLNAAVSRTGWKKK